VIACAIRVHQQRRIKTMTSTVYVKQAYKSAKGAVFAPGKSAKGYVVYKLCENYDGNIRGGVRKSWRVVANGLTLEEAKALMEKRVGRKIYD
jgi:hypothetical protein